MLETRNTYNMKLKKILLEKGVPISEVSRGCGYHADHLSRALGKEYLHPKIATKILLWFEENYRSEDLGWSTLFEFSAETLCIAAFGEEK